MRRWWKKLVEWWRGESYFSETNPETQWVRIGPNMEVEVGSSDSPLYRVENIAGKCATDTGEWYRLEPPISEENELGKRMAHVEELFKKLND